MKQNLKTQKSIIADNYDLDILKAKFGINKYYPISYEVPILIALSYFPELKNSTIYFVEKESEFAFSSQPALYSLFKDKHKREYKIILSTYSSKVPDHLLFSSLPLNVQVGILGHELTHTVYYLNKSIIQLIILGIKYLIPKFRITFEKNTDKATIDRGLGYQLLDFAKYTRENNAPKGLVKWLNTYYLSPEEIQLYIQDNENTI